jgi:transposase
MDYYAALDVSLRSVHLCVVDDVGELIAETKLSSEVTDIIAYLDSLDLECAIVGLEAGTLAQYLTYGLQSAGYGVVCMEARQVNAGLSAMRNKTDKSDARGIAQLLRTGWYSPVHIKSMESHRIRTLLASRKAVLRKCIDLENEIRGLFKIFGIKLPAKLGHGSFDAAVRDIEVRCTLYTAANALLTRSAKWSPLKAWGMQLAKTRGHRRAVIAVARKLAVILHRMWLDDTTFRWNTEVARS